VPGNALKAQEKLADAESAYRAAIRLQPDFPEGHCNLGHCLLDQGRFADALKELERGHALGSKVSGWRYPSDRWVLQCERLIELDRRLPALLAGDNKPADAAEGIEFAALCALPGKRLHATAARLYADPFANAKPVPNAKPVLIEWIDGRAPPVRRFYAVPRHHRYNAARSAALAAAGEAKDAKGLSDKVTAVLRGQALGWLRDELADARQGHFSRGLAHCQQDAGLASVRERESLDRLPPDERQAWNRLWEDIKSLRQKQPAVYFYGKDADETDEEFDFSREREKDMTPQEYSNFRKNVWLKMPHAGRKRMMEKKKAEFDFSQDERPKLIERGK
jgi:tetratricopeptide (TPR) repeat protein